MSRYHIHLHLFLHLTSSILEHNNVHEPHVKATFRLLPFQAEDAIENAAACVSTLEDKYAAQDIEVQLVFWDCAHHSGLKEGRPLPLQGPLTPPVILHTVDNRSLNKCRV